MSKLLKRKLLLFNGPPRSGKDTAVQYVLDTFDGVAHLKLAGVLKDATHGLYGLAGVPTDYFEEVKGEPQDELLGLTPRQAYINVAEKLFKPVHGETVFPELLTKQVVEQNSKVIAISDLGFQCELDYFVEKFGAENIVLYKIYRTGCTFANDSREYVEVMDHNGIARYPGLHTITLVNDDLDKYKQDVYLQTKIFVQSERTVTEKTAQSA